jgi:hypothetical protein
MCSLVFTAGAVVQMMMILWFSQGTIQLCSDISDEHTASIFTMNELVSNGY